MADTKDELITAYAYSNLQRAILTAFLADQIRKAEDPAKNLQEYYGTIKEHLRIAEFPPADPNADKIRIEASRLAKDFFRDVELLLKKWGTISEKTLNLWD